MVGILDSLSTFLDQCGVYQRCYVVHCIDLPNLFDRLFVVLRKQGSQLVDYGMGGHSIVS
jgi:hypothetical protein